MRWLFPVLLLLAGTAAGGDSPKICVFGKVVSVPDAGSIWVYIEDARASYQLSLAGVTAPPENSPEAKAARDALAALVMGHEVQAEVASLTLSGRIPACVYVENRSVNNRMVALLAVKPAPAAVASTVPLAPVPATAVPPAAPPPAAIATTPASTGSTARPVFRLLDPARRPILCCCLRLWPPNWHQPTPAQ